MSLEPRSIFWIASYPKSGNTWVRFMLANLLFGRQESASEMGRLIPDIHELRAIPPAPQQLLAVKTHFMFTPSLPLAVNTRGAIYIVRNPMDVMVSNFHYLRRSGVMGADDVSIGFNAYFEDFLIHGGDSLSIKRGFGSWEQHLKSWIIQPLNFPVLLLRYEQMLVNPLAAAMELGRFLGLNKTEAEYQQAVDHSSFERMKEIEEADIRSRRVGIFYKPYLKGSIDSGLRFMREGKAGRALEMLSQDQRRRFDLVFGPMMRQVGYPSDGGASVS